MTDKDFVPYIPAEKVIPELTAKVIVLGGILSIVMGAANAYLGLYVGMTVSASIPAAVISMAIMRMRFMNGNILENNMVKTMAAAGEALAAGVIFTIPSLLVIYKMTDGAAGWETMSVSNMDQYLLITGAALIGGVLGTLFTIPLRRMLIVDLDLPYPEGVACTEVLIAGDKGGKGLTYVFSALIVGALYKFAGSEFGLRIWKERVIGVLNPEGNPRMFFGMDMSAALLGVGYIIGPTISLMVFSGGVLGWLMILPVVGFMKGFPDVGYDGIIAVWRSDSMNVGIGAIIVGGIYTLFKMRHAMVRAVKQSMGSGLSKAAKAVKRTEMDFPVRLWYYVIIAVCMGAFYWYVSKSAIVTGVALAFMLIFAFFFTAVAGYIAGVVGSSNNPISGVTVATLLFTAIVLLLAGAEMNAGMTATVLVAAIVCCSAAIAGDCMQELKTGQLLGSTPKNLQIAEFIGALLCALVIAPIVMYLHQAYTITSPSLPAPQATVMGTVVYGIFTGKMNWIMFGAGVLLAFIIIALEKLNIAQISIMAVAIGVYLPLTLTVPIFLGGILKMLVDTFVAKKVRRENRGMAPDKLKAKIGEEVEKASNGGILIASGLVAGEALMGVLVAVLVISGITVTLIPQPIAWPGILLFFYIAFLIAYMAVREMIGPLSPRVTRRLFMDTLLDPLDRKKR
jgi:putative OPT family oligopeptide transporter